MGSVTKKIRKIIPKEIRPAVPFIAAYFGGPALGAKLGIKSALGQKIAGKALTAALASKAQGDDTSAALRSAALAASPDVLSGGLGKLSTTAAKAGIEGASPALTDTAGKLLRASRAIEGAGALKTVGAQSAIEGSAQLAEIQQDQIDAYNRQLQEQGLMDKTKRRQSIFNIYMNAGYEPDYVNSVLDKYGYADGGIVELIERIKSKMKAPESVAKAMSKKNRFRTQKDKEPKVVETKEGKIVVNFPEEDTERPGDLASGLSAAAQGVERAFGRGFGNVEPVPMLRFAKGGEVEEEVSESGIMTVASAPNNFAELNMLAIDLFGRPYDQLSDGEQETLMDFIGSKSQAGGEGIMQMASGYKSDIEEMYEQYVFEMEEQGLQPMSFSEFLAQARSGMAKGGMMKGPDWFTNRVEQLMYEGLSYEEASEQAYNEGHGGYKKGGDVMSAEEYFKEKGKQEKLNNMERMRREYEEYKYKKKYGPRNEAKDGGIMEKDMRGGGFIPEGSKERADDVPARLSKNEFVMTADAVRAAGGGSVNKGAKRMYDLMYTLEGKI